MYTYGRFTDCEGKKNILCSPKAYDFSLKHTLYKANYFLLRHTLYKSYDFSLKHTLYKACDFSLKHTLYWCSIVT